MKVVVEVQGYEVKLGSVKVSIEGTKEDANQIAQQVSRQLSGMVQAPAVMTPPSLTPANGNEHPLKIIDGEVGGSTNNGKRRAKKSGVVGGNKASTEDISFVHDPEKYGTPQQGWGQAEKAIWFLYIVSEQATVTQQTAYSIEKNFNKHFKSAGQIYARNVGRGLEKEKMKGPNATVGTDMTDGTGKYFLTTAGIAMAKRLAMGEAAAAGAA